jgi:hypothetical protein
MQVLEVLTAHQRGHAYHGQGDVQDNDRSHEFPDWPASELFARFPDLLDAAMAFDAPPSIGEISQLRRIQEDYLAMQRQNVLLNASISALSGNIMTMLDEAVSNTPDGIEAVSFLSQQPLQQQLLRRLESLLDELWMTGEVAQDLRPLAGAATLQDLMQVHLPYDDVPSASQVPVPARLVGSFCMSPSVGSSEHGNTSREHQTQSPADMDMPSRTAGYRENDRQIPATNNEARSRVSVTDDAVASLSLALAQGQDVNSAEMLQLRQLLSIRERVSLTVRELQKPRPVRRMPCAAAAA